MTCKEFKDGGECAMGLSLTDTVDWMLSDDWKLRLKAEYWQAAIRVQKVSIMINKCHVGQLFISDEEFKLLLAQRKNMMDYMLILSRRAELAGVSVFGCVKFKESEL